MIKKFVTSCAIVAGLSFGASQSQAQIISLDFDEGSGTTVTDSVAGLTGTFGFTFDPVADTFPTWVSGPTGADGDFALSFDGIDDLVMVDDPDGTLQLDVAGTYTFEAYVKLGGEFDTRKIVFSYGLPGGYSFSVDVDRGLFTTTYGIADIPSDGTILPDDGAWHHIAATYDGAVITYYIDGVAGTTVDYTSGINPTEGIRFLVGIESVNFDGRIINPFLGMIDRVKVYNSVIPVEDFDIVEVVPTSSAKGWELYQ